MEVKEETIKAGICEEFCFNPNKVFPAVQYQAALENYNATLEEALNLEGDHPIFLDTNVLLDFYRLSFTERGELLKFFETNKKRIWLTSKIEEEFLTHRIDHIRNYLKSLDEFVNSYRNIKEELDRLKQGEIRGFDHYLDKNIILKNDYQDLRFELKNLNESIKEKLVSLFNDEGFEAQFLEKEKKIEEIRTRLEEQAKIERQDPLLSVVAGFNVTPELSEDEIGYLKTHFDKLNAEYDEVKGNQSKNWKRTFPGCGEKKEEPYGDFIIYHEILKFMKSTSTNAIFLTNDVEKNDWLLRDKSELVPYTHYITNAYVNSGFTFYIFQAKDKIRISYDPVYLDLEEANIQEEKETVIDRSLEDRILKRPVVVDTIDLRTTDRGSYVSWYDKITEEDFVRELKASESWAERYGDGFVGMRSFINKYLGSKGYDYEHSYDVKDRLIEEGKIEVYKHEPSNPIYNPVDALRVLKT